MIPLSKPLYSLNIGEFIELSKEVFSKEAEKIIRNYSNATPTQKEENEFIFINEVSKLTGYTKSTLYSKVCRFETPVLSRNKPLTFSKKAIINWINNGKPSVVDQEMEKYLKTRS